MRKEFIIYQNNKLSGFVFADTAQQAIDQYIDTRQLEEEDKQAVEAVTGKEHSKRVKWK